MSEIEKTTRSRERLLLLAPMAVEAAALRWASPGVTVVRTGVGPERAAAAAAFAPRLPGRAVAVAGFCGALTGDLRPGDIVVATEVRGPRGLSVACSSEPLVAALHAALGARGVERVLTGPVLSVDHVVRGAERATLAVGGPSGAVAPLAVDMESFWLAPTAAGRPFAVLRVVLDTPAHEVGQALTMPIAGVKAWRVLRRAVPALTAWARGQAPV